MHPKTENLIKYFQDNGGIARFSLILKDGFHPDSLAVLERNGQVEKIGRGLYRLTDYISGSHPDLVTASLQAPRGVICLLSALSFYEATSEIPRYVDIAIPRNTHANRSNIPLYDFTGLLHRYGKPESQSTRLKVTKSGFIVLLKR